MSGYPGKLNNIRLHINEDHGLTIIQDPRMGCLYTEYIYLLYVLVHVVVDGCLHPERVKPLPGVEQCVNCNNVVFSRLI